MRVRQGGAMTHTHTLEFTLLIDSSDPLLDGSSAQLGAFVHGEIYLDAGVADAVPGDMGVPSMDVFSGAVTGGLVTLDMSGSPGGIDAEIFLGSTDVRIFHNPFQTDFQMDFFAPDGNLMGVGNLPFDLRALSVHLSGTGPDTLPHDSLQDFFDAGLDRFTAPGNASSFLVSFDSGTGFPLASGALQSLSLHAVPGPGPLTIAGTAAAVLLCRRLRR